MSFNTVWTKRKNESGESWGTGTQTVEVAAEELAAMRARLEELEAKSPDSGKAYSPLGAINSLLNDQNGGPPPPGMGLPSGTPPPSPGKLGPAVQRVDFSDPAANRPSQMQPVVESSERDFTASIDTKALRASFAMRNSAPAPLEGTLYKKSPSGPVYQERPFALADGVLSYVTGKGEAHILPLPTLRGCDVTDEMRFEFVITSHGGREYACRAVDSKSFKYWVEGLQAHFAFEPQRKAAQRLQSVWRGHTQHSQYAKTATLVKGMQQRYRAHLQDRVSRGDAAQYVRENEVARMRERVSRLALKVEGPPAQHAHEQARKSAVAQVRPLRSVRH